MSVEMSQVPAVAGTGTVVCRLKDLPRERGAAVRVDGVQVALFRTRDDRVYAVQQLDPYSGAHVISRGIVGSRGDIPIVASPMYKQVFDLRTGDCLDPVGNEPRSLRTFAVDVTQGIVTVGPRRAEGALAVSSPGTPARP